MVAALRNSQIRTLTKYAVVEARAGSDRAPLEVAGLRVSLAGPTGALQHHSARYMVRE